MRSSESTQTWCGTAEESAVAVARSERVAPGAANAMRSAGMRDGATTGLDPRLGDVRSGALPRALDLSGVRIEEVVRLRLAILSGNYVVSAAALADKLIAWFGGGRSLRKIN